MSSLCLSSVLTGANFAMYQTAVSDVVPQQLSGLDSLDISSTAYISGLSGELLPFCSASCVPARVFVSGCVCVCAGRCDIMRSRLCASPAEWGHVCEVTSFCLTSSKSSGKGSGFGIWLLCLWLVSMRVLPKMEVQIRVRESDSGHLLAILTTPYFVDSFKSNQV